MKKPVLIFTIALALGGCASINSLETSKSEVGLKYFLPMKDVLVNVTVGDDFKVSKVSIGTTSAYPDFSSTYVLKYERNLVGKNSMDVVISDKGLLTSAKSTTVSNLTDALKNAAMSITATKSVTESATTIACGKGEYAFIYQIKSGKPKSCGIEISIQKLGITRSVGHGIAVGIPSAGIYYRQSEPYLVTATGAEQTTSAIVFSPSQAPAEFLPITRSLFTGSDATLAFEDGMPKGYKQESDGELVALFKLPADVLAAYFSALGSTFDSFKSNDDKQAAALTSALKLDLAKQKYEACTKAIKANDAALIKQLEC